VNEPTTQKGYGVRSRITDQQSQFYIHHLLHMFKFSCDIIYIHRTYRRHKNTDIRASIKQWNATGYTVWHELPAWWKKSESNLQTDYFEIAYAVHFNQLLSFYQTNQMHINMHNSTVSLQVCAMNEQAVQCIHSWCTLGVPKQRIIPSSSAPQMFRYGTLLSVTFEINSNKILTIYIILRTYILISVTVFLLHYIIHVYGRHAVWQFVVALRYKPEGRGFDSRRWHWIFHGLNPSGRTMGLGSTQSITETRTRPISWGVKGAGWQDWRSYHLEVPTVQKSGSPNLLEH